MSRSILLVGGGSRLSRAVRCAAPASVRLRVAIRRPESDTQGVAPLIVDDYAAIAPAAFAGCDTVINCVGVAAGDDDLLNRVNAIVPAAIGVTAKSAGVRHVIHVSSLSVYGPAETLDAASRENPAGAYGRSKLAGDRALRALEVPLTLLRIPTLYGQDTSNKIARLLRLAVRMGALPAPRPLPRRSVLHVDNAAALIWHLVEAGPQGVTLGADREPFDLSVLESVLQHRRFRAVPVPRLALAPLRWAAPGLHASLYRDSLIAAADNIARNVVLPLTLRQGLTRQLEMLDTRAGKTGGRA